MRYADIADTGANRFRLPLSHPILAAATIDPADWHDLQRLDADDLRIRIVGHDASQNGSVTVHIACASLETRRRLEDGCWG